VTDRHGRPPGSYPAIRRLSENVIFRNAYAAIYDDPVEFGDGRHGSYLRVIESDGRPGVAILPLCDHKVALVRTYRHPLGSWEWAVPRGFAHGEDADLSARAELAEELGGEPEALIPIGMVTPNSGLLASRVLIYLARYSAPITKPTDRAEVADARWVDVAALYDEIASGSINDGFTLSAISLALCLGLIEPGFGSSGGAR
jgi:8-oxo-dGTP pyrophosphatase MutT (NUDIX family)